MTAKIRKERQRYTTQANVMMVLPTSKMLRLLPSAHGFRRLRSDGGMAFPILGPRGALALRRANRAASETRSRPDK
jgi:hypothetical protein